MSKPLTESLDRYAVFGNPVSHSKSPRLHSLFAEETGEAIEYIAHHVEPGCFEKETTTFFENGGKGLNITVPFKGDAFAFAHKLTDRARRAGAVNTLHLQQDGTLLGDTTDGPGLVDDMVNNLDWPLAEKSVLIIGAGGAVRGILQSLIDAGVKSITISNRTQSKAETLCEIFSPLFSAMDAKGFGELGAESFDVVINGTSGSLSGELPPIDPGIFKPETVCYDMMYASEPTVFMRWAQEQGVRHCADGLGMLVCQGAASFEIWRGKKPGSQKVIAQLREEMAKP